MHISTVVGRPRTRTVVVTAARSWPGASSADDVDPLFDSATGRQGALVQALGGTLALSSSDCGSAIGSTGPSTSA